MLTWYTEPLTGGAAAVGHPLSAEAVVESGREPVHRTLTKALTSPRRVTFVMLRTIGLCAQRRPAGAPTHQLAGNCGGSPSTVREVANTLAKSRHNHLMPLRCVLVDDDAFARTLVAQALQAQQLDVVKTFADVETAMDFDVSRVDAAVIDLDLGPGPNGVDLAYGLRRKKPRIGIVILTSFSDPRLLASSVGDPPPGSAYVVKQSLTEIGFLVEAIRGSVERDVSQRYQKRNVELSDSQIETLRLLAYGLSNSEIAKVRVVSEKAVEHAITRAAATLGLDRSDSTNVRVALARTYFELTGAARHRHVHR